MCGICGFVSQNEISVETLKNMNDTMIHRGPDDSGEEIFFAAERCIGMAQRRLAIIDLSEHGHQPMHSYDKNISLVFNGEIYNYKELKKELDYPFISQSDTEVIIAAYLKWGIECLSRFNGMFALALYDHRDNALYLARDRIGKKPLYYWLQNKDIVFASELKPIMSYPGFPKKIRREILPRYLSQFCINAPDTIFENTWKIEPGHVLCFKNGEITDKTWWDLVEVYHEKRKEQVSDYREAMTVLREKLLQATRLRLISDVPQGMFLSGGYDSSLVTALAQSISKQPVKTFCIGFYEKDKDEAPFAKAVSEYLGTDHTELYISEDEMKKLIDSIPECYDEPFADSSQIPTMLVSALAKREITVALTGDGGDEFFCGYESYDLMPKAQFFDLSGAVTNMIGKLPIGSGKTLLDELPFSVRTIAKNRDKETKTQFGGFNYIEAARKIAGTGLPELFPVEIYLREPNWQRRRMLLDMLNYLPGDVLCKVDRASMKYSLETRCPLLDVDVMEYSFSLQHNFKYKQGNKKRILKDLTYEYIPKHLLDRRKTGFSVPLDKWLRGSLRQKLVAYTRTDLLRRQGIFEPEETQKFVDDYITGQDGGFYSGKNFSKTIWSIFVFQAWYEKYIGNL